ncbi:unnamed protein product [Rhizophagus irregularis]|nr:unnamed protein product [Rhizophagus irregularis]
MSSDLFRPKIDTTVQRNQRPMKTIQTNVRSSSGISNGDRLLYVYFFEIMSIVRLHQSLDVENKCSPPEEADENQDPLEEDDQAEEDENQEVVDKNQEEVDENQEDEEEDQNKNKRGVNVVSSEYDSISSE